MTGYPTLVVLSPHPDDAVLALGGLLTHKPRLGHRPMIVTVFAGTPPNDTSPIARRLYADHPHRDDIADDIAGVRRREDLAAGNRLQVDVVQLPHLDALFRTTPNGAPLYTDLHQIFAAPSVDVEPAAERLARDWLDANLLPSHADVLAPLGIGGHVDHRIVRRAAELVHELSPASTRRLHYYEDQPYAARRPRQRWRHLIPQPCVPTVHHLTETMWQNKCDAIACHASQIPLLWPGGSFQNELHTYAETIAATDTGSGRTVAERTWSPGSPIGSG